MTAGSVRSHLRRRLRHHLANPPGYCLCNRFDSVDRLRLKLIDRFGEDDDAEMD